MRQEHVEQEVAPITSTPAYAGELRMSGSSGPDIPDEMACLPTIQAHALRQPLLPLRAGESSMAQLHVSDRYGVDIGLSKLTVGPLETAGEVGGREQLNSDLSLRPSLRRLSRCVVREIKVSRSGVLS